MGNVMDYVSDESRPFDDMPFGPPDALALSCIIYYDIPSVIPTLDETIHRSGSWKARIRQIDFRYPISALRQLSSLRRPPFCALTLRDLACGIKHDIGGDEPTRNLIIAAARNPRFATIALDAYDEQLNHDNPTQFAAVTMRLPDGTLAIVFRGTDDSFTGWKEDFTMAFQYPVPAQYRAAEYLQRVASIWRAAPLLLIGHSKGGNLAIYAAMNADDNTRKRIKAIYSLDGPGFPAHVVNSPEYQAISNDIIKIIPDASIVGMILESPEHCQVVRSNQKGPLQHWAFSWQIHQGALVQAPNVSTSSRRFNQSLTSWLSTLSPEQCEHAVNALFAILSASGATSFSQLRETGIKALPSMVGTFVGLSDDDRRHLLEAASLLFNAATARNSGTMTRANRLSDHTEHPS